MTLPVAYKRLPHRMLGTTRQHGFCRYVLGDRRTGCSMCGSCSVAAVPAERFPSPIACRGQVATLELAGGVSAFSIPSSLIAGSASIPRASRPVGRADFPYAVRLSFAGRGHRLEWPGEAYAPRVTIGRLQRAHRRRCANSHSLQAPRHSVCAQIHKACAPILSTHAARHELRAGRRSDRALSSMSVYLMHSDCAAGAATECPSAMAAL
jgi:hypothetical protein